MTSSRRKPTGVASRSRRTAPTAVAPTRASPVKNGSARAATPARDNEAATSRHPPRHKLVRDSFTMPKDEYALLGELKLRALKLGRPAKKGEVLRAGVGALHGLGDRAFLSALAAIPSLKTGRPPAVPEAEPPRAAGRGKSVPKR